MDTTHTRRGAVKGLVAVPGTMALAQGCASSPAPAAKPALPRYERRDVPLPSLAEVKAAIPRPVFDARPDYLAFYDRAWELGHANFRRPAEGSPFVANFIDEAFNDNIFLWDMSFSVMWGRYAQTAFDAVGGLDNFYALQSPSGEIVREIDEATGALGVIGWSEPGTPGSLNHPMLAWAELKTHALTGDTERLARVLPALAAYRESFEAIRHAPTGLYLTDKAAMDDSPRNDRLLCGVDTSSQMVTFDRWLAEIAQATGDGDAARRYEARAAGYARHLNEMLWDEEAGFYFDWAKEGGLLRMRTIAGFWPMLGGMTSDAQVERLAAHLEDPASFKTEHRVPTHPKDEVGYDAEYWAGSVWAPTNTMVVEGLILNGRHDLAREIAVNHLDAATAVFGDTGTAWENYDPEAFKPGSMSKPDFVGWSGLAPITYLIEHAIGVRPDAAAGRIDWRLREAGRCGVENLALGHGDGAQRVALVAEAARGGAPREVSVTLERPLTVVIDSEAGVRRFDLQAGPHRLTLA